MDELLLIETVERYLKGDMTAQEKIFFEEIRKKNPDIDQLVVYMKWKVNWPKKVSSAKNN